jgi:hypothetical protein
MREGNFGEAGRLGNVVTSFRGVWRACGVERG